MTVRVKTVLRLS